MATKKKKSKKESPELQEAPKAPPKEVQTEVTSVAKEEQKTGEKINLPSPEELKNRAASAFIANKARIAALFPKLSSKEKNRVMAAILDLPTDGVPVYLKSENEKLCFALGQRMISDRFVLTYFHVAAEVRKSKEVKQSQTPNEKEEKNEPETKQ